MEAWVWLSIAAAAAQTARFALQKVLASGPLGPAAATWARFLWSAPVIVLLVASYVRATQAVWPALDPEFWPFAVGGAVAQILATVCTLALFGTRAFAVGITFKKTEVMLTAVAGLVILGDRISGAGAAFVAAGFVAVLLLSRPPDGGSIWNRGAALGLLSGIFFALSAVGYRGATLAVQSQDTWLVAGVTLAFVTSLQTLILGIWLLVREPGQMGATLRSWRTSAPVGIFSLLGSWCWFAAFSLQNAAYVFAVGQIELVFSLAVGALLFADRPTRRELLGMILLTCSVIGVAAIG